MKVFYVRWEANHTLVFACNRSALFDLLREALLDCPPQQLRFMEVTPREGVAFNFKPEDCSEYGYTSAFQEELTLFPDEALEALIHEG